MSDMLLRKALTLAFVGMLCGCTSQPSPRGTDPTGAARPDGGFVYATETETGVVRGGEVVARLPRSDHGTAVPLTRDGRFLYTAGDNAISVLDVRSLERRDVSCDSACQDSLKPLLPLGDGLIGGFDTGGLGGNDGTTDVAAVKALDLADTQATPKSLGEVRLAFPHPVQSPLVSDVQAYSFFLDAAPGEYLFLDFASHAPPDRRPWESRQILHLARPDGTLLDLGEYAFPTASAVWGAISPDGRQSVVGDWNYAAAEDMSTGPCETTGVNLFDTATGEKTTLTAPGGTPGSGNYRVARAWWGRSGTLHATFQQGPCVPTVPGEHTQEPPPMVWMYRDGQWSQLPTSGPAIQALDLGAGRLAVIRPAPPKPLGHTTEYDLDKGSLVIVDGQGGQGGQGGQKHIADDVTALVALPTREGPAS